MTYWIDLFTGTTWEEFLRAGGRVSGFRHRMRNTVRQIEPGDILLCYVTGVMRWIGALEVVGPSNDKSRIWKREEFPCRVEVKRLVTLSPEESVPMELLEGRVSFYEGPEDRGKFKGFVRRSPYRFSPGDGEYVHELLKEAKRTGKKRKVDPVKWKREPLYKAKAKKGKRTVEVEVSVPEREEEASLFSKKNDKGAIEETTAHTETQYRLGELGAELGFNIWIARNDRNKQYNGKKLKNLPKLVDELPTQFDVTTSKVVEMIDVLWLKKNSIAAAFEIECTTAIYSGLLRMSDLLSLQPNIKIKLYIAAPEARRQKVRDEILRPTFKLMDKPVCDVCGFIGIEELITKVDGLRKLGVLGVIKAEFLDEVAEYFSEESD